MALKDVGNKVPIYKLKTTDEVMKYYDEWGEKDKYNKDMVEWNYTGPQETVDVFKRYIENYDDISFLKKNYNVAIITPDKDIIPGSDTLNPAYIVFDNYEIILQWNRSLRFALAVCTLKDKFKNEL